MVGSSLCIITIVKTRNLSIWLLDESQNIFKITGKSRAKENPLPIRALLKFTNMQVIYTHCIYFKELLDTPKAITKSVFCFNPHLHFNDFKIQPHYRAWGCISLCSGFVIALGPFPSMTIPVRSIIVKRAINALSTGSDEAEVPGVCYTQLFMNA